MLTNITKKTNTVGISKSGVYAGKIAGTSICTFCTPVLVFLPALLFYYSGYLKATTNEYSTFFTGFNSKQVSFILVVDLYIIFNIFVIVECINNLFSLVVIIIYI